jgi:hypothetical protein
LISPRVRDWIAILVASLGAVLFLADAIPFMQYDLPDGFATYWLIFIGSLYLMPPRKGGKDDDQR